MFNPIILLVSIFTIFGCMTIAFFFLLQKRNLILIDLFRNLGVILAVVISFTYLVIFYQSFYFIQLIASILLVIWQIKVILIKINERMGIEEIYLLEKINKKESKIVFRMFIKTIIVESLVAIFISAPVLITNSFLSDYQINFMIFGTINILVEILSLTLGFIIWMTGFSLNIVCFIQKNLFYKKYKNRRKIIKCGLWKFSRHPDSFSKICMNFGIFILLNPIIIVEPLFLLLIFSPIIYLVMLLFIKDIPEKERILRKIPGYIDYMKQTSILIPLPPKKKTKN